MKKILFMIIAALAFMAWSCSKSDDDDGTNNPGEVTPQPGPDEDSITIAPGTDAKPAWENPNYDNWEQTMSVRILMQKELEPYVTGEDLLCAMMKDEVRGLTPPVIEPEGTFFPLTVGADGAEARVFLHYYCDSLHRIFTIDWADFNASTVPMGDDSFYRPVFVK